MKRIFNFAAYINMLICMFLMCSCTKTSIHDTDPTSSYINLSFGTRSSLPSLEENKESGVNHLRIIIFDAESKQVSNTKYTATNAGRVPNPVIKLPGGQKYTIYAIANEGKKFIANVSPDKKLTEVLDGVKTISDMKAVAVKLDHVAYTKLPEEGLLMIGSTEVDAKFGHSMLYPQGVSIPLKRLTSKITLNARREAGMTIQIIAVKCVNLFQYEFLTAKNTDYSYPPGSLLTSLVFGTTGHDMVGEGSTAVPFSLFDRYFLGTNYAGDERFFSLVITYDQKVGIGGAAETKNTTITISSAVERNMEYVFNLNFRKTDVNVGRSVKNWDDQEISGEVIGGNSLSLSQSELTMYGSHQSTIYLQTDAAEVKAESKTESGEDVSKYFTNLQGGITVNKGSGMITLMPNNAAMSPDPAKPTQIGLYFKAGNIRKLVRVTHINREAYEVELDANGGYFGEKSIKKIMDNPEQIGSSYTIKSVSSHTPTRDDHRLLGWALSKTALVKEFSLGAVVKYEDLERPKKKLTLYAVWSSETVSSLVFNPNGKIATNIPSPFTRNPNAKVTIPTTVPLANGGDYIFKEWNTKADGTGDPYRGGDLFTLGTELSVLYAIWIPRPVTITLVKNYYPNPDETIITYTVNQDSKFTITVADPSRPNYFLWDGIHIVLVMVLIMQRTQPILHHLLTCLFMRFGDISVR